MAALEHKNGMRIQDREVFCRAAMQKKLWILVRETNPHSLEYVGRLGYMPKPIEIKAKTADCNVPKPKGGTYKLRGLVVAPRPQFFHAFAPAKINKALKSWEEFEKKYHKVWNSAFKIEEDKTRDHYGCLMKKDRDGAWKYIHGDYDLKDIIEEGLEDWNLAFPWKEDVSLYGGVKNKYEETHNEILLLQHDLWEIVRLLNLGIGVDMVQHGSEAQYADHSDDSIVVFSPDGRERILKGKSEVENFYRLLFNKRKCVNPSQRDKSDSHINASPRLRQWSQIEEHRVSNAYRSINKYHITG